jgi:hypothetical protein
LTRKLDGLKAGKFKGGAKEATDQFREEMKANFRDGYHGLKIPEGLVEDAKQVDNLVYIQINHRTLRHNTRSKCSARKKR